MIYTFRHLKKNRSTDSEKTCEENCNRCKEEKVQSEQALSRAKKLKELEETWKGVQKTFGIILRSIRETPGFQSVQQFIVFAVQNMVFYTGRAIIEQMQKNTKRDIRPRFIEGRQFDDFATHTVFKPT